MSDRVTGFHHITMICGDPQRNLDFYSGKLGLRLVKLNVNMDDPSAYHLYYGDGVGSVGSILTFFPYPGGRHARPGKGMIVQIDLDVPVGSLEVWAERFRAEGVDADSIAEDRFGGRVLGFRDHEGLMLRLVEFEGGELAPSFEGAEVPPEAAIRRFAGIRIAPSEMGPRSERFPDTETLLRGFLGFDEAERAGGTTRLTHLPSGVYVDVLSPEAVGFGHSGFGSVHHVAFATPNAESQLAIRDELHEAGFHTSPIMERNYFKSLYFREPSAVLFEVATQGPGLAIDEPLEALGGRLSLPPWLEERREEVEAKLPRLVLPNRVAVGR